MTEKSENYRYPGSYPFQDTEHDRRLFFGRDREKETLLHIVLANNLVVLFAKSGIGKTSLINAALLQSLREEEFLPFQIRFNQPEISPLEIVYTEIETFVEQKEITYHAGDKATLWQYFKTAEFRSDRNTLLIPVLILDQFEEFFEFYSQADREIFILQIADILRGRIPKSIRQSLPKGQPMPYTEAPPEVKILIAIREDSLGYLQELASDLPGILRHRFRLMPLTREQAQQVIINPAQQEDPRLMAKAFRYSDETLEIMLDFLCQQRQKEKMIVVDEVDPFQLQLLCQHIERMMEKKTRLDEQPLVVQPDDLEGEHGMQEVLEEFYKQQLDNLHSEDDKKKVRKLCEYGLISETNRRLSLEEGVIEGKYGIAKQLLAELVTSRLLRAESRLGSIHYELSHDTLVQPIRESQKDYIAGQAKIRRIKMTGMIILSLMMIAAIMGFLLRKFYYYHVGNTSYEQEAYTKASHYFERAIKIDPKWADAYTKWGDALAEQEQYAEAIEKYRFVTQLHPKDIYAYIRLGDLLSQQKLYEEAVKHYQTALELTPEDAYVHSRLGDIFTIQGKLVAAAEQYNQAIQQDPLNADGYRGLGKVLLKQGNQEDALTHYTQALDLNPEDDEIYKGLGNIQLQQGNYAEAIEYYQQALQLDPEDAETYKRLGDALSQQKNYAEAIRNYNTAQSRTPDDYEIYEGLGNAFLGLKQYDKAKDQYNIVFALMPQFPESKMNLAKVNFLLKNFYATFYLANEALEQLDPELDPKDTEHVLAMKFFQIAALFGLDERIEASDKKQEFIDFYAFIQKDYEKTWQWQNIEDALNTFPEPERGTLLELLKIIETSTTDP